MRTLVWPVVHYANPTRILEYSHFHQLTWFCKWTYPLRIILLSNKYLTHLTLMLLLLSNIVHLCHTSYQVLPCDPFGQMRLPPGRSPGGAQRQLASSQARVLTPQQWLSGYIDWGITAHMVRGDEDWQEAGSLPVRGKLNIFFPLRFTWILKRSL